MTATLSFDTTAMLQTPDQAARDAVAGLAKTAAAHDAHLASLPAMTQVELGGRRGDAGLSFPFTVAAWNLERCLFPRESAALLRRTGAKLVLLSEMDCGMARTAQRHPTAEIACDLDMAYVYGVEFLELSLGSETERSFCIGTQNARGFHGNALLTSAAHSQPFLARLDGARHWFVQAVDQPRLGERMAIGARVETTEGPFVAVSTHLESVADAAAREAQLIGLIAAVEAQFGALPMLIGGDLNTGNHIGGDFRDETLFDAAAARGFARHGGPLQVMTTRPSLISRWPERAMKLDWFLSRGLTVTTTAIHPALDAANQPLSDHELISCCVTGFA